MFFQQEPEAFTPTAKAAEEAQSATIGEMAIRGAGAVLAKKAESSDVRNGQLLISTEALMDLSPKKSL